jgi:hypothetical protein
MATGPGYPSGNNTFVPADISGRLRVGFSRAVDKFHLPNYVQYVETPNTNAYFLKITSQEAARVVNVQDFEWPDGQPDRSSDDGSESFNFVPFTTSRKSYKFRLGDKATQQAVWPIVEQHGGIKAAQCMTSRTVRMLSAALNTSNWTQSTDTSNLSADHTATASTLVGGYLDQGTSTSPNFKNALGSIADLINQDTLGVIDSDPDKFTVIISPTDARKLAASPELHEYIKGSPAALAEIHEGSHPNGKYGLPTFVYGYKVIVENAIRVTSKKGATRASSYPLTPGKLLVVSRPGEIDGIYGAPSFSTLTMFWWKDEMTVETDHDNWDRLTKGRVVEDTYEAVTCPASGYLVTSAFSS